MHNSFVGVIVGIGEQGEPVFWQAFRVYGKAMILRCDVTPIRFLVNTRLVVPSISISASTSQMFHK